jgi:hypothetical protein
VAEARGLAAGRADRRRLPRPPRRRPPDLRRARRQGDHPSRPLEGEELADILGELAEAAREGRIEKLAVEKVDGEPVIGTELEQTLVAAGFRRQPRRLVA